MLLVIKFQSRKAYLHKLSASLGFLVTASISYYMGYASIAHEAFEDKGSNSLLFALVPPDLSWTEKVKIKLANAS